MSYFPSAREAARALGLPLLLREEADPRAFRRHEWLGTLAVPAASAARLGVLAFDELARAGGAAPGAVKGTLVLPGAIWVTGLWGSLAHLPWAVGLADHLARTRGRAGLIERELDGPLRALARAGRRIPIRLPLAEALLGGPVDAVNTDLEGVSIFLRRGEEARAGDRSTDAAAGDVPLVLADGLPEALEGPYPGADSVAGVILVASFRDHSRFELGAVVRRLRETGHRILGLTAIGPEISDAEEAAALQMEGEAGKTGRAAAGVKQETPGAGIGAAPVTAEDASLDGTLPALTGMPCPVASPGITGADVPPAAAKLSLSPPDAARPDSGRQTMPEITPETTPEITPEATPKIVPETTLDAGPEQRPGEPPAQPDERATILLLSTWDRLTIGRSRQRRLAGGGVTVLLMLVVAAAFYGVVLRPRLRPPSWPSIFRGKSASLGVEKADVPGEIAPTAVDSTISAAESTGTAAESTGTSAGLAGIAADTGRVATDSVRMSREESGNRLHGPAPGFAPGSAVDSAVGLPDVSGASRTPGLGGAVSDTTAAAATPPDGGSGERFVIHLTSFKLAAEAEMEVSALRRRGIDARSIRADIPDRGTWYRIVTGNFATFAEAESVALRLQDEGKIPYAHIAADGGRGQPVPVGTLDRVRP
jgi:cell division septation protein DedD